jgi:hypothetical protein
MEVETGVLIVEEGEEEKIVCQICDCDEATKYCKDCSKNYCDDCLVVAHKKRKDHNLVSPKRKLNFTCKIHNKNVNSFCHECEVFTCFGCVKKDEKHFGHKVEEIENSKSKIMEVAQKNSKNSKETRLLMKSKMDILEKEAIELQNSLKEKMRELNQAKDQFSDFERISSNFDISNVENCMEFIHFYPPHPNKFSWNPLESHPKLKLSNNNMTVTGKAPGDVIGTVGFSKGTHQWYINVDACIDNSQFFIGVCLLSEINKTKSSYASMYGLTQQGSFISQKGKYKATAGHNWLEKRKQAKVELYCDSHKLIVNGIEIGLPSNGNSCYEWFPIVVMGWYHDQEQITLSFEENDSIKHLTL